VSQWWYWALFALAATIFAGGYLLARVERRRQNRREHERWERRQQGYRR